MGNRITLLFILLAFSAPAQSPNYLIVSNEHVGITASILGVPSGGDWTNAGTVGIPRWQLKALPASGGSGAATNTFAATGLATLTINGQQVTYDIAVSNVQAVIEAYGYLTSITGLTNNLLDIATWTATNNVLAGAISVLTTGKVNVGASLAGTGFSFTPGTTIGNLGTLTVTGGSGSGGDVYSVSNNTFLARNVFSNGLAVIDNSVTIGGSVKNTNSPTGGAFPGVASYHTTNVITDSAYTYGVYLLSPYGDLGLTDSGTNQHRLSAQTSGAISSTMPRTDAETNGSTWSILFEGPHVDAWGTPNYEIVYVCIVDGSPWNLAYDPTNDGPEGWTFYNGTTVPEAAIQGQAAIDAANATNSTPLPYSVNLANIGPGRLKWPCGWAQFFSCTDTAQTVIVNASTGALRGGSTNLFSVPENSALLSNAVAALGFGGVGGGSPGPISNGVANTTTINLTNINGTLSADVNPGSLTTNALTPAAVAQLAGSGGFSFVSSNLIDTLTGAVMVSNDVWGALPVSLPVLRATHPTNDTAGLTDYFTTKIPRTWRPANFGTWTWGTSNTFLVIGNVAENNNVARALLAPNDIPASSTGHVWTASIPIHRMFTVNTPGAAAGVSIGLIASASSASNSAMFQLRYDIGFTGNATPTITTSTNTTFTGNAASVDTKVLTSQATAPTDFWLRIRWDGINTFTCYYEPGASRTPPDFIAPIVTRTINFVPQAVGIVGRNIGTIGASTCWVKAFQFEDAAP